VTVRKTYDAKGLGLSANAPPVNLQSRNYLEKAAQQTDLPDLLTLSCQHAVRTKSL